MGVVRDVNINADLDEKLGSNVWFRPKIDKKELKDFEDNLLPLGLLVLALGLRESLKSPDYVRLINFEISGFIFTLFAVIIGCESSLNKL